MLVHLVIQPLFDDLFKIVMFNMALLIPQIPYLIDKNVSDYVEIVQGGLPGLWNVPFIGSAIFISKQKLADLRGAYKWNVAVDADISFAQFCRENVIW